MKGKFKIFLIAVLLFIICILLTPQIFHKNKGESKSIGDYNGGSMKNGYLLPRSGENFICYSWLSYYLLGREYVNSKVYYTVLASYADLEKSYPDRKFVYMEAAKRDGGRIYPHRTHQSGLSIDFMSPLVKKGWETKIL
ncbi:MAG: hypothetical protein HC830_00315 [Bacteroidetes bacterium]|nr:hypothetical protein [Bacteroidota bacterium]